MCKEEGNLSKNIYNVQLSNKKQNNSWTATEAKSTNLVKQEPNKDRNSNNKKIAKNSQTKIKNHKTSTKKLFLKNKKYHEISQISKEKPKNLNKN